MLSFASKPLLWTLRASLLEAVDVAVEAGVPRVPSRASRSRQRRLLRVPSLRAQVVVSPRGIFQKISDDWDEEERAQWDASGDWNEEEWAQWDASAQWTEEEWAEWEKGTWPEEGSSKPRGKRSRDKTKAAVAPKPVVPAAAPTGRSRPKQMGRARPGNHASIHEIDENDTFDYPRTFARRAKPPIKGSDSEKVWMAIAKGFLEEIAPAIENGTRSEAEAGFTQETMCCQNVRLSFQIDEPRNLGAGLGRLSTGCMPEFAGSIVELALGTLASTSSC